MQDTQPLIFFFFLASSFLRGEAGSRQAPQLVWDLRSEYKLLLRFI